MVVSAIAGVVDQLGVLFATTVTVDIVLLGVHLEHVSEVAIGVEVLLFA